MGHVLERLGPGPDLAVLFVSPGHGGALADAAAVVRTVLGPTVLIGAVAGAITGPGQEVETGPAIALWAGQVGLLAPVELQVEPTADGQGAITGWPEDLPFTPQAALLVGDPFSFPIDGFLAALASFAPGLPVAGGMATGAGHPGASRLLLDDRIVTTGAVGVLLGPGIGIETVVSQGCRPVGAPFVVTKAEGNFIHELGGQPALARFNHLVEKELDDGERALLREGLFLGLVIDEHKMDFGPGDFLIRNVMGADRSNGAIAIGDTPTVGTTVQFHVRDAETADAELSKLLTRATERPVAGALLFTCNGRGTNLFPAPHHDALALADATAEAPAAGFFANGEIGPIGGRNFLHSYTASVVLFRDE